MAVTDIKIYAGDTEGWVSISEFGGASTLCELTDVSCDSLGSGNVLSVNADGDAWESAQIGDLQIGRPPLGSDWETNTIGWNFTNAGNLLMGESKSEGGSVGPSPDPDEPPVVSEWQEGSIGYEIDSLRVLFEEGGGGSTPSLPPGENAGDQYDERNWSQDAGIANNAYVFARDGVFSNGKDWSVDGLTWARAPRTVSFSGPKPQQPVKLTSQGVLYISSDGTAFSYDMKSWYPIATWITGNPSYGQRPLSTVFVNNGTAFIYARYRSSFDLSDSSAWRLRLLKFNPSNGSFSQVLPGQSSQEDNLLAFPFFPTDITGNGGFVTFTTHESGNFVLGLQGNGTHVTRIDSQGVGTRITSLDDRLPVESFTYGNNLICAKLDNGTTLSSNGTSWSSTSLFPQAGNYGDAYYDDVGRWHVCGPAGQPLICYGEGNGSTITWSLVNQEVPSGGSNDAYVAATAGRVIVTQMLAETYLITGQVDGVYTVDVKLTQTSGEIFSLASPRLIIDNAETQQDANQIFVDRFQNAGNLLLGTEDEGGVWAAGTIGKALEDISKAEGPAGADGKGWTGGSYDSGTGIVTFTSNDGLGFETGDLRGSNGTDGTNGTNGTDGKGWTGGSYNATNGIVTFTSNDGLGFTTGDLRGSNGTNGTNGTDGTSVDLTTVGVAMTDCDLTPAGANGSFTADGTDPDGTKKYKLDLNLPRGTVVTESEDEPPAAGACVGDLWIDPTDGQSEIPPSLQTGGGGETCGRLTVASGNANGQGSSGVIYYTPYLGNKVPLFNGESWKYIEFSELSVSLAPYASSNTANGTLHDAFMYLDGDTPRMSLTAWNEIVDSGGNISDQSRIDDLVWKDGIRVASSDPKLRYLGTLKIDSSGQTQNTIDRRLIWNMSNRLNSICDDQRPFAQYTIGPTGWRRLGGTDYHIEFVNGIVGGTYTGFLSVLTSGAASTRYMSLATAVNGPIRPELQASRVFPNVANAQHTLFTSGVMTANLGINILYPVESVDGTNSFTNYVGTQADFKHTGGLKGAWEC